MKVTKKVEVRDEENQESILLKGEIVYNSYPYNERVQKYIETMDGIKTDETSDYKDDLKLAGRYFEVLKERVEKVDVELQDGTKITNIDDLYEYAEGMAIGNSLALQIVSSQRLGKKKLN